MFARMQEAATWEAPSLVQETLVDQIQDVASIISAIRLPTATASESESSSNTSVEFGIGRKSTCLSRVFIEPDKRGYV